MPVPVCCVPCVYVCVCTKATLFVPEEPEEPSTCICEIRSTRLSFSVGILIHTSTSGFLPRFWGLNSEPYALSGKDFTY